MIAWRYICIGAIITALLFYFGKLLLGLCLGRSSVTFAHGAAGSMVIVLLWVYFYAQILFFGAEYTQIYFNRYGLRLEMMPARKQ
jgi:membrane protein